LQVEQNKYVGKWISAQCKVPAKCSSTCCKAQNSSIQHTSSNSFQHMAMSMGKHCSKISSVSLCRWSSRMQKNSSWSINF